MKCTEDPRFAFANLTQSLNLILQNLEYEFGIELWIVDVTGLEAPILIVLDEMMVRVSGKRERVQPERIYRRL